MKTIFTLLTLLVLCFTHQATAQCSGPAPDLGNDTSVCQGQSVILNPGSFNSYLWDNNSTAQTRSVSQPGTYWVRVGTTSGNLITNGDFEQGNTGFSTDYVVGTGGSFGPLSNEGTYAITTSPNVVHTNFSNCQDHTPAPGTQMMVVNGAGNPNTNVWCQTVNVQQNTDYQFSTWVSSALNDNNVAQLQFSINGNNLGMIFSPTPQGCDWDQFYQTWNSGVQMSAQICIVNQNTGVSGNDFMIDDISFAPVCYQWDTINVTTAPAPVITATPNDTICVGETSQITASSATPGLTYTWNPGNIQSDVLNVSPAISTFYSVSAVSPQGCVSNLVSRLVYVSPSPTVSIQGADTICSSDQLTLTTTTTGNGLSYTWSPNLSTADTLADSPLSSTVYSVLVENANGCQAIASHSVYVIPPLSVNITGDVSICDGEFTTLTGSANIGGTSLQWSDGTSGSQVTVDSSNAGTYYLTGTYQNCPTAIDSVTVNAYPIPVVTAPEDFVICPGEAVTATLTSDQPGSTFNWSPLGLTGAENTFYPDQDMYVYVVAQNGDCVSAPDSFFVSISAACFVEVPNVFTPNADGANDFFALSSYDGIESLNCTIVNRWGEVVAEFDMPSFQWNGEDQHGNELPDGTYFYTLTARTMAQEDLEKQGFVQLIRE